SQEDSGSYHRTQHNGRAQCDVHVLGYQENLCHEERGECRDLTGNEHYEGVRNEYGEEVAEPLRNYRETRTDHSGAVFRTDHQLAEHREHELRELCSHDTEKQCRWQVGTFRA